MLRVEGLAKLYGGGAGGVRGLDFAVEAGEFFTLLGPSGCGKTTTLRCIAGLETPDAGTIEIGGRPVFAAARGIAVPTAKRDIAMVFQSYAIWPHMTVGENVAFPLEAQHLKSAEVKRRVADALQMVGLDGMAGRPAPNLSGGQQQRVALARAIVKGASLLLLDEPLSNLDAHLRGEMRRELSELQRRIGITTVYVTHDQEEALSLSDRIAVMQAGAIVELDVPARLYYAPRTAFVARFIGQAELLPCRPVARGDGAVIVETPVGRLVSFCYPEPLEAELSLAVRPEHVELIANPPRGTANLVSGVIEREIFTGKLVEYAVRVGEAVLRAQCTSMTRWAVGAQVTLRVPPERCILVNGAA
ncbi:MAG TPA: ABC transporter ATP-binding protein [Stellaceae bacterium]|nr:ABC transporter ATP-binding protein [Stellaceae bacterium]